MFDAATINLENNKTFVIQTKNNSNTNIYIQSIALNGKKINRNYITHEEIMQGGTLIFTMGDAPKDNQSRMALSSEIYK
jgi:putative alpha-1,2-mannosidase